MQFCTVLGAAHCWESDQVSAGNQGLIYNPKLMFGTIGIPGYIDPSLPREISFKFS